MKLTQAPFRTLVDEIRQRACLVETARDAGIALRREDSLLRGLCPFFGARRRKLRRLSREALALFRCLPTRR